MAGKPKLYFCFDVECWCCEWKNSYQGYIVGYGSTASAAYFDWKCNCQAHGWIVKD